MKNLEMKHVLYSMRKDSESLESSIAAIANPYITEFDFQKHAENIYLMAKLLRYDAKVLIEGKFKD